MSEPFTPEGPSKGAAQSKVNAPATALMVVAVINIVLALWGVVNNLMSMANPEAALEQAGNMEGVDPEMMEMVTSMTQGAGALGIVLNIVAIILAIVILMGALKMKKLESFGFCMTASILAQTAAPRRSPATKPTSWSSDPSLIVPRSFPNTRSRYSRGSPFLPPYITRRFQIFHDGFTS